MPRVGNPAQPTAPAAAINTATPLTRPDEFSGKDNAWPTSHAIPGTIICTGHDGDDAINTAPADAITSDNVPEITNCGCTIRIG